MTAHLKHVLAALRAAIPAALSSDVPRFGAALSYYTLFAIAPMFIIALAVAGFCFGEEAARRELFGQLGGLVGRDGAEALQGLIAAANRPKAGMVATVAAVAALLVGATGAFVELQSALNRLWNVETPVGHGIWRFVKSRLLSFAMVVGIGFLLMVSLIVSALLAALGGWMQRTLPGGSAVWQVLNFLVSLGIVTVLFALIFKVLPEARIAWGDVWVGALFTALLFNLGKFLLGFYLGRATVASAYGSAGSLVVILIWVYYSAQILFFGAKYTQIYSERSGSRSASAPAQASRNRGQRVAPAGSH
jgi:membrane protein